jgi:hypothetical protein
MRRKHPKVLIQAIKEALAEDFWAEKGPIHRLTENQLEKRSPTDPLFLPLLIDGIGFWFSPFIWS